MNFLSVGANYRINMSGYSPKVFITSTECESDIRGVHLEFPLLCCDQVNEKTTWRKEKHNPFKLAPVDVKFNFFVNMLTKALSEEESTIYIELHKSNSYGYYSFDCQNCKTGCMYMRNYSNSESVIKDYPSLYVSFYLRDIIAALALYYGVTDYKSLINLCKLRGEKSLTTYSALLEEDFDANAGKQRKAFEKKGLCGTCTIDEALQLAKTVKFKFGEEIPF